MLGADRARYAGKRVLVVGSGHSAFNAILDLVALRDSEPATQIVWAIRGGAPGRKYGGGGDDQLPGARRARRARSASLVADGVDRARGGFQTRAVSERDGRLVLADGERELVADEVIAATGFRPDLALLGELRLDLDDRVEAARALAPLIDPNLHSCGTRAAARRRRALAPRRRRLHGRHEELRPRADVPAAHRLRAGRARSSPRSPATGRPRAASSSCCPRPASATARPRRAAAAPRGVLRSGSSNAPSPPSAVSADAARDPPGPAWRTRAWAIVAALSVTETVSWGILYYAFAAFLVPMQRDLGYSAAQLDRRVLARARRLRARRRRRRPPPRPPQPARADDGGLDRRRRRSSSRGRRSTASPPSTRCGSAIGLVMAAVLYEPAFTVWPSTSPTPASAGAR